jgi:PadR family transcriptional regulator
VPILPQAPATAAEASTPGNAIPDTHPLTYCAAHSTVQPMGDPDAFGKLELELRRGVVVLATLSQLRTPRYGYELRQALADQGMLIEEGTLYPLLRRLETQGLLRSEWRIEDGPPRRYYSLNADGRRLLRKLTESWQGMNDAMERLLKEADHEGE